MSSLRKSAAAIIFGGLAISLSLSACAPEDLLQSPGSNNANNDMGSQQTQFEQVASFLATNCATSGCHTGESFFLPKIEGGVNATPQQVQAALEGISNAEGAPLIAPNDPDNSLLWRRLIGNPAFMPPGPGLAMDKVKPVQDWINAGAKYEFTSDTPADMGDSTTDMPTPDMGATGDDMGDNVSPAYAEVVRIMRGCATAGCHDASSFSLPKIEGGVNATPAQVEAALKDVASGQDPNTTLVDMIYLRISGTTKGNQMPLGQSPLSQTDIDAYKAWLDAGANYQ